MKIKESITKTMNGIDNITDSHLRRKANDATFLAETDSKGLKRFVAFWDAVKFVDDTALILKVLPLGKLKNAIDGKILTGFSKVKGLPGILKKTAPVVEEVAKTTIKK